MNSIKIKMDYIFITILIIGLFLIFNSFLKQLNFPDVNYQLTKSKRVTIIPGETLQQKFISTENGLSNVKILFGGKSLAKNYFLDLILADTNCQKEIRKKTLLSGQKFSSKNLYDFKFLPIDNSENKKYCLKIVYKTIIKNPKKKEVRLFENTWKGGNNGLNNKNNWDELVGGGYKIIRQSTNDAIVKDVNKKELKNNLPIVFRPSYKNPIVAKDFQQLNQRMSQYKPWFLKGWYLDGLIMLGFTTVSGSMLILFKNKK